jgi:hypothetical protein
MVSPTIAPSKGCVLAAGVLPVPLMRGRRFFLLLVQWRRAGVRCVLAGSCCCCCRPLAEGQVFCCRDAAAGWRARRGYWGRRPVCCFAAGVPGKCKGWGPLSAAGEPVSTADPALARVGRPKGRGCQSLWDPCLGGSGQPPFSRLKARPALSGYSTSRGARRSCPGCASSSRSSADIWGGP